MSTVALLSSIPQTYKTYDNMLRKIHSIFHPNSCSRDLVELASNNDTISPVRLVRSTSMYVVGTSRQNVSETLKKYKSTTSIDVSTGGSQYKDDDRVWMFAKTQDFLQYLQDLLALRKKYLAGLHNLKSVTENSEYCPKGTTPSKDGKKPAAPQARECTATKENTRQTLNSDILDAISYFDAVISELDSERRTRETRSVFTNEDVDFDVATSSREHSLHSNWILRVPRRTNDALSKPASDHSPTWRDSNGTTSYKRIQRYPIYLPKAVEGAFNTLRFNPKSQ